MSVYLHDSMVPGHRTWSRAALVHGEAAGIVVSPFFTPQEHQLRHPSAQELASEARSVGGDVIFDATSHAFAYTATDLFQKYSTWDLWLDTRGRLDTNARREAHLERVSAIQDSLESPRLAPTIGIDNAIGSDADDALALAELAVSRDNNAWISLAGRRGLWLSPDLDSYVGAIQGMRSMTVAMTLMRDGSGYPPDNSDTEVLVGYMRTIRSLSLRSRVIAWHSDLTGLLASVAGADTIGSGWHGRQRTFGPSTHQQNDPDGIQRTARWFTYAGLLSRLHRNEHELLVTHEAALSNDLYTGVAATGEIDRQRHHLGAISAVQGLIAAAGDLATRVQLLRELYGLSADHLNEFSRLYSREFVTRREQYIDAHLAALNAFAAAEGL